MPRTSVSISEDLRRRMNAAGDAVNWSKIACDAFEKELAAIARRRTDRTWDRVVERLRASKLDWESDEFRLGHDAGTEWAMFHAEWIHLENLGFATRDEEGSLWEQHYIADKMLLAIDEPAFDSKKSRDAFWKERGVEGRPTTDFLHGFVDGAMEVLDEVNERLQGSSPNDPRRNGSVPGK